MGMSGRLELGKGFWGAREETTPDIAPGSSVEHSRHGLRQHQATVQKDLEEERFEAQT